MGNGYQTFAELLKLLNQLPAPDVWNCINGIGQDGLFHELLKNNASHAYLLNLLKNTYMPEYLGQLVKADTEAVKTSLFEEDQIEMSVLLSQVSDYYSLSTKENLQSYGGVTFPLKQLHLVGCCKVKVI